MKTKILLLILFILPLTSQARLAMQADFAFIISNSNTEIIVNDDGSYESLSTINFKVLKEEAKAQLSLYKFQFDPSVEEMSVIEAYVENGNEKVLVNKANIQKSAIAAKKGGIVNSTEIAIPYSQIKVGSNVYVKILVKSKKGPFGKYFSQHIYWGDQLPERGSIAIRSSSPLYYKANDPKKVLAIIYNKEHDGKYWLRAQLNNLYSNVAIQELGKIPKNESTFLSVSNMDKWEDFRQVINTRYEPVLKEKLPNELVKVTSAIAENASFDQKVSTVLEYITSNYNYLGDWRGKGKYVPKLASKIAADRFGDCKDFSTLLVKMLRSMKIQADFALVERSYDPLIVSENFIPNLNYFNHMIVRVQNNEDVYWIDPTNNFSLGLENRNDISDRSAFVLGSGPKIIESIQKSNRDKKFFNNKKTYTFLSEDEADVEGVFVIEGETSRMLQDSFKDKTQNEYQEAIKQMISQSERAAFTDFQNLNTKKNAYSDLDVKYKYKTNNLNQKKDKIDELNVLNLADSSFLLSFRNSKVSDVGTTNISMIPSINNEIFYKNIYLSGKSPLGCDIKSDWVDATRKIELLPDGIVVKDFVKIKKDKLSPVDLKDVGFASVANDLAYCFVGNTINYDFGTKKHVDKNSIFENSIAHLSPTLKLEKRRQIASETMENGSSAKTKDSLSLDDTRVLLAQNLLENPNDVESLRLMGMYYKNSALIVGSDIEINSMKRALEYIEKVIALDPNLVQPVLDKISIMIELKLFLEAYMLFEQKALKFDKTKLSFLEARALMKLSNSYKISKSSKEYFDIALKNATTTKQKKSLYGLRAMNHLDNRRYQDCVENYKWAIKLDGSLAWDHGNLSICYDRLQRYDEAIQSAKNALKIMDYGAAHYYLSSAYLGKAKLEMGKKNFKEAEELLQQAVLEGPEVKVYYALTEVYLELGQEEKARAMAKTTFEYEDQYSSAQQINLELARIFKKHGIEYK